MVRLTTIDRSPLSKAPTAHFRRTRDKTVLAGLSTKPTPAESLLKVRSPKRTSTDMKSTNYTLTLGLIATLPTAESVKEFDTAAKRDGATLDGANSDYVYRGQLPQWWKAVDAGVRSKTGLPFLTKPHPKEAGKNVRAETPAAYIQRVVALGKIDVAGVQAIADSYMKGTLVTKDDKGADVKWIHFFDPSETPAGERSVKPTKGDIEVVVELRKRADFASKLANLNKATGSNLSATSTNDEIAIAFGAFRRKIIADTTKKMLG